MNFRKIQPKRTRNNGGTLEFWNPEFQQVLPNYRPTSPRNRRLFLKIGHVISGSILAEIGQILQKIGH
jgi:hypothetical protein